MLNKIFYGSTKGIWTPVTQLEKLVSLPLDDGALYFNWMGYQDSNLDCHSQSVKSYL